MSAALVHASSVVVGHHAVLIRGRSGAGKSSLALSLIGDGALLLADDYTHLEAQESCLVASAPATIAGRIEVRGYGVIVLPHVERAPVALVVDLCEEEDVPRLPEAPHVRLFKRKIPRMFLGVHDAAASGKIRAVLKSLTKDDLL